jgi:two-component system sensor histidine kinase TctE
LLIWLLLPQLVLWLAAAMLAHAMAVRYTNEVIDQTLAQTSRALARQVNRLATVFMSTSPCRTRNPGRRPQRPGVLHGQLATSRLLLGEPAMPRPPGNLLAKAGNSYFYNASMKGQDVRVAALYLQAGSPEQPQLMLVQVAKSRALSAELTRKILLDMGLPCWG